MATAAAAPAKSYTAKQLIIAAVVVFIIIALIAWHYYKKGKSTVTIANVPIDQPGNAGGSGSAGMGGASNEEIKGIANDLYTDMDGFNLSGHDVTPYQKLLALSNTDFVNVYNVFNTLYQPKSKQTLRQWIESEYFVFDDVTDAIIERMGRLTLK